MKQFEVKIVIYMNYTYEKKEKVHLVKREETIKEYVVNTENEDENRVKSVEEVKNANV